MKARNFSYARTMNFDKIQAQANFMQGEELTMTADALLQQHGSTFRADMLAYEGIDYIRSSGHLLCCHVNADFDTRGI